MRILCVCEGGNTRSVALARLLRDEYGVDALACGWRNNSGDTLDMLCRWADHIVVMQREFKQKVGEQFQAKVRILDVGPDVFGTPTHPALTEMIVAGVRNWEHGSRLEP